MGGRCVGQGRPETGTNGRGCVRDAWEGGSTDPPGHLYQMCATQRRAVGHGGGNKSRMADVFSVASLL